MLTKCFRMINSFFFVNEQIYIAQEYVQQRV
jgi:hypothetical protein